MLGYKKRKLHKFIYDRTKALSKVLVERMVKWRPEIDNLMEESLARYDLQNKHHCVSTFLV